jgi:hypothetical protein
MSRFDYIRAAYRLRHKLAPQLAFALAVVAILVYDAFTSPLFYWFN